ncbi:MAG: O-antigen ligase family protein [Gemmatimonadaceae bacterium]
MQFRPAGWRAMPGGGRDAAGVIRLAEPKATTGTPRFGGETDPTAYPPVSPIAGVEWTPVYLGFMLYVFVVTTYMLDAGTLAMGAALIGLIFLRGGIRFPVLLGWLAIFILWGIIGYAQTRYPHAVWERLILLSKLWLVALAAANALRTSRQLRLFIIFFLACYALFPVRGALMNKFFYGHNVAGRVVWNHIFENPNDLAALTLLQVSMVVGLLVTEPKGWVKWAAIAGAGVLPLLILMTQSRGAILALAIVGVIGVWSQRKQLRKLLTPKRRTRLRLAAVAIGAFVLISAPRAVWDRLSGLTRATSTARLGEVDEEGSARQRWAIWKIAWQVAAQDPLIGVGVGAYPFAHLSVARLGGKVDPLMASRLTCVKTNTGTSPTTTTSRVVTCEDLPNARGFRDAHSTYLYVLAETGVVGLLIFSALFITTVVGVERIRRRAREYLPRQALQLFYLELGLLAFFLAGIFGSFSQLSFLYIHLVLVWAASEVLRRDMLLLRQQAAVPMSGVL